jgi:hypothetical protein
MSDSTHDNSGTQLQARLVAGMMRRDLPFLARPLARYVARLDITWMGLADRLGCSMPALNSLACCRAPRPEFIEADIFELSCYTGIREARLRSLFLALSYDHNMGRGVQAGG